MHLLHMVGKLGSFRKTTCSYFYLDCDGAVYVLL